MLYKVSPEHALSHAILAVTKASMSSNVRTTFVAEVFEPAARAAFPPRQIVPDAGKRNNSSASAVSERTLDWDLERNDSGIDMESLRSGDCGGIELGEEVERDHTKSTVARDRTLHTDSRQPKAEQEVLRNEIRHAHADTDTQFGSLTNVKIIASATKVAPGNTQKRNHPPMNFMNTSASISEQRLNEQQRLQDEEHRIVRYLLPNRDGDTGLHLAVILQDYNALDKLLQVVTKYPEFRNSIDDQNTLYQTPLHLALHTRQHDMVRKLVISGASLLITDHKGNTPLHIACSLDSTKCLDEILAFSPITQVLEASMVPNNEGLTCVHLAAGYGCKDVLRKLKKIGVDMNSQDLHSGKTALHFAAEKQQLADTYFLIESCGLDIDARTFTGCTPLHIAAGRGNIETVAYLLSVGANPELQTDEGDTPLKLSVSDDVTILLTKVATLKWLY